VVVSRCFGSSKDFDADAERIEIWGITDSVALSDIVSVVPHLTRGAAKAGLPVSNEVSFEDCPDLELTLVMFVVLPPRVTVGGVADVLPALGCPDIGTVWLLLAPFSSMTSSSDPSTV
jgi:hypothetical protein